MDCDAIIVGAGVAGFATARALHKIGARVIVLERADAVRENGQGVGVWRNAFTALDALGCADHIRSEFVAMAGLTITTPTGRVLRTVKFPESEETRAVTRSALLSALRAGIPGNCIRYNSRVANVQFEGPGLVTVVLASGETMRAPLVIGADGDKSEVARVMGSPPLSYSGYHAFRGIISNLSPAEVTRHVGPVEPSARAKQIVGAGVRVGLLPLTRTSLFFFLVYNAPADAPTNTGAAAVASAVSKVEGWAGGIADLIRKTAPGAIHEAIVRDRNPKQTWANQPAGNAPVTLVGDALHLMTPNLAQGACVALEDAVELAQSLHAAGFPRDANGRCPPRPDLVTALRAFEARRLKRAAPMITRARAIGKMMQASSTLVIAMRNAFFIPFAFGPRFLAHTNYDCGVIPEIPEEATQPVQEPVAPEGATAPEEGLGSAEGRRGPLVAMPMPSVESPAPAAPPAVTPAVTPPVTPVTPAGAAQPLKALGESPAGAEGMADEPKSSLVAEEPIVPVGKIESVDRVLI